jgi:hypothetical protein
MKERIVMDDKVKQLLSSSEVIPEVIILQGHKYFPKQFITSEGYKSVVWKGLDTYTTPVAIKFATYEDYMNRSYLEEANRAAKLRKYPSQFAYFHDADIFEVATTQKIKCVCFVEEWVDGSTLKKYIQEHEIHPSFIINYVKEMCQALSILKNELEFRHDDLHLGNVMIADPKKGSRSDEVTIKIIDTGSIKPYDAALTKEKDDHGWFVEHLRVLYNATFFSPDKKRKPLTLMERRFQKEMTRLLNSMLEEDRQICLFEPQNISQQFEYAYTRAQHPYKDIPIKLEDPFDYISAEHITSDELLIRLFADSCPWIKEVTSPNPVLLTGPRGCGKSMLFRRMSLKALLYQSAKEINNSLIAGFYMSCSADFRNRFGYITSESVATRFQKEIIHYFNLLLSREIIQTLLFISHREDRESLFGFGAIQEKELHDFMINKLGIKEERRLRLQGITPLEHLRDIIEFEMNECYGQFLKGFNLVSTLPSPYLSDLTRLLKDKIVYLQNRTITFLVDDFSVHRISGPVQQILNPIIWDRQTTHIFKLSTEKYGAERIIDFSDESSPTADITRELREIDCGQFYIDLSDRDLQQAQINFSSELLNHRLELAGYVGTAERVIGHSIYEDGSLGKALKYRKENDQYHGLETISQICSGDVSALLEIYRNIFKEGNVTKFTVDVVPANVQHGAIQNVSRKFFEVIKTYYPSGSEMNKIVLAFGTLCRKLLTEGKDIQERNKNGTFKSIPLETTRIEVDQIAGKEEDWTDEQKRLMRELVRRAIFIEMTPGRGRHTLGPTWRWQLRRIYCPTFRLGLSKRAPINWTASELKYFLTNPEDKCKDEFEKRRKEKLNNSPKLPFHQKEQEDDS